MSWSASSRGKVIVGDGEEVQLEEDHFVTSPPYPAMHDEPKEQFHLLLELAEKAINSGALGPSDASAFEIHMYGHANKDHDPDRFSSGQIIHPETLSLTIRQSVLPDVEDLDIAGTVTVQESS